MLERHWRYHPALLAAICFAAGILVARAFAPSASALLALLFGGLGWFVLTARGAHLTPVVPVLCCHILCGALWYGLRHDPMPDLLAGATLQGAEVVGVARSEPAWRAGRIEFEIAADSLRYFNSVAARPARVMVRLYDTSAFDPRLLPGPEDRVTCVGTLRFPGVAANPGQIDPSAAMRARGFGGAVDVRRAASVYVPGHAGVSLPLRARQEARRALHRFADEDVRGEEGDIVRALVLDEREEVDPETIALFSRVGVVHVLSVSGFHVGVLALGLFVVASWVPGRWLRFAIFTVVLASYALLVGAGPAILRATIMAIAFMLARTAGRIPRPLNTLGLAALVILLIAPAELFDVGFQLSFASVAGIILLYGRLVWNAARLAGRLWRFVAVRGAVQAAALSLSAQAFTLPFALHYFGYVPFGALVANAIVVPLYSVALGAAFVGAPLSCFIEPFGAWLGAAASLALRLAGLVVAWCAELPFAGIELPAIGWAGAGGITATLLYAALGRSRAVVLLRGAVAALTVVAVLLAERMGDPLARRGASSVGECVLVLLAAPDGTVPACLVGDRATLFVHGRSADSASAARLLRGLVLRFGPLNGAVVNLDSIDPARGLPPDLLLVNARPREFALRSIPLIFSMTEARPLGSVSIAGAALLQVPLRAELDRALVLRYRGRWEAVQW